MSIIKQASAEKKDENSGCAVPARIQPSLDSIGFESGFWQEKLASILPIAGFTQYR
jgi:hypothetical protein